MVFKIAFNIFADPALITVITVTQPDKHHMLLNISLNYFVV